MAAFKPVKEVTEGGSFKPVREVSQPTSAITGRQGRDPFEQTSEALGKYKQAAATGVRYGVPIAAGLATGGMGFAAQAGLGGLAAFGAELTASQIERAGEDPELDALWQDIKAGGAAGALDVAGTTATHGLGKLLVKGAGRFLIKSRAIPKEVELAQAVLATPANKKEATKWWKWTGKDPFSLSLHQLNPEEQGLVYHLEAIARSGSGAGRFAKFDERNVKHVQAVLEDYIGQRAQQSTGPEFASFINRILGETNKPGELFKPVLAYRTHLYEKYKEALSGVSGAAINGSSLRKVIRQTKDPRMVDVYRELRAMDLLPALKKASDWEKLDVLKVDEAIHQMNGMQEAGKSSELFNKRLHYMRQQLRQPYDEFLETQPGLQKYKDAANKFYGKEQDLLNNATIKTIRHTLIEKPSTVIHIVKPTKGDPAASYDALMRLKNGLKFSAESPKTPGTSISGMGMKEASKEWENNVLRPLRFEFVLGATDNNGIFQPKKILQRIKKIESAGVPQYLNEIWGSPKQVKQIKELFRAMDYTQTATTGKSIFVQMKTAAAVTAGGAGVWALFAGDSPKQAATGIGGAAVIMMSPAILAKTLANPRLCRALYDGYSEKRIFTGIGAKMSLALRKMSQMKAASEIDHEWYRFRPMEPEGGQQDEL